MVESPLRFIEVGQLDQAAFVRVLNAPKPAKSEQGFPVHQHRAGVRKVAAQLGKDGETVGVDVTPVA